MKKVLSIFVVIIISIFMLVSLDVNAEELTTDLVSEETTINENNNVTETSEVEGEKNTPAVENVDTPKEEKEEVETDTTVEVHKVAVITKKVDEQGNPLSGALLQIIDSNGNVVDEWLSDGTEHESMLPEGDYILHEVSAPKGYIKAKDQSFTVEVVVEDVIATTDHDDRVCSHYPTELYYVESNGVREEVYCINQGWSEPNDTNFDGTVLTEENIRSFLPDSDDTMTNKELYDKVLDIIYHRINISDEFASLRDDEIRLITEYALKNYTSAKYNNGNWARQFAYAEDSERGYVIDKENGTSIGKLAEHWWKLHYDYIINEAGRKVITGRNKLPKIYGDYFNWLIRDEDHHPSDMHLYVYSTESMSEKGPYQNLLSIKWFNPYDEDYKVELECVNYKKDTGKTVPEIVPPVTGINSNNASNNYLLIVLLSVLGFSLSLKRRFN